MSQLQIVKASAGSGKTFMLAYEYIKNVVSQPYRYKNILAVTFTNKATDEMKNRILEELFDLSQCKSETYSQMLQTDLDISSTQVCDRAKKALSLILHDYSNFSVMTIDGFFQKVVRSFVRELHLDSDYDIDFNTDYLLRLATDLLIHQSHEDTTLRKWIDSFIEDNIEQSKNFDLRGDMRTISKRILDDEFNKQYFNDHRDTLIAFFEEIKKQNSIFEETLKDKADQFLRTAQDNGLTDDDFAFKKAGFISYVHKVSQGIFEDYGKRVEGAISENGRLGSGKNSRADELIDVLQPILRDLCELWDGYSNTYNSVNALLVTHRTFVLLGDISSRLDSICSTNNKMLLENTNYLISQLIGGNDAPFIYEKMGCMYETIMIDEFQDTSRKQWSNFLPLIENSLSTSQQDGQTVTIVGDVKQSIYRWRGGDWRILGRRIKENFSDSDLSERTLDTNYRSKRTVIDFNNNITRLSMESLNIEINTLINDMRQAGNLSIDFAQSYTDMLKEAYSDVVQKVPNNKGDGGYAELMIYDSKEQKDFYLQKTVDLIIELQNRGYSAGDITILVRTNKQAAQIVDYIMQYKEQNPQMQERYCLDVVSNKGLLLNKAEVVKFIIAVYKLIINDDIVTRALFNRYMKQPLNAPIADEEMNFINSLAYVSLYESFESIVAHYKLNEVSDNIAYIQALHEAILSFAGKNDSSVMAFMEWWDSERDKRSITLPEGQNAINIVTTHSSKGLQYRVVIIPQCNWSMRPMSNSLFWTERDGNTKSNDSNYVSLPFDTPALIQYNKKLGNSCFAEFYLRETILSAVESFNTFYVALTRAEDEIYIMLPEKSESSNISTHIATAYMQMDINGYLFEKKDKKDIGYTSFSTGVKMEKVDTKTKRVKRGEVKVDTFNTLDYHDRIRLHLESDKYYRNLDIDDDTEEDSTHSEDKLDPRGRGIMLHKVFEQITSLDEVGHRVESMVLNGYLTKSERDALLQVVSSAASNPLINSWFEEGWDVRNENSIVVPTSISKGKMLTLRPDRVICKGERAVVIDYKFGHKLPSHRKQIEAYKNLLIQMGYKDVIGYVWYISDEHVEVV